MKKKDITTKALVAAMGAEANVAPPSRARSSSFASMVASLEVGDAPAVRAQQIPSTLTVIDAISKISEECERLRNNVTPSVAAAKRKIPGSDFSVEVGHYVNKTGMYVLALITRIA